SCNVDYREEAMQPAIQFENVSKRFMMTTERPQTILEWLIAFTRGQQVVRRRQEQALWAVRDISFELPRGECLGIIGRNGSGKSTMLKLIAGILRPTQGRLTVRGRVSALLELGAGFHPDLTGRENIYLNGSVLGLNRAEIEEQFDSIVDFSELADFIDVPVKHYSSGMYVRLGFSVAIHVKPDILILDEILAVGDQSFQTKCMEQIYTLKRRGATIILVSHNLDMVRNLATRLLWIEHGKMRGAGPVQALAGQYMAEAYHQPAGARDVQQEKAFERWGTGEIEITGVRFLDGEGQEKTTFRTNDPFTVEIAYHAHKPVENPEFGLAIYRQDGVHVNGPNSNAGGLKTGTVSGPGIVRYCVQQLPLLPARYHVTVAVHDNELPVAYDHHDQAYNFRVVAGGTRELHGLLALPSRWEWDGAPAREAAQTELGHVER
ncbi:MAG: ABC transporter ATP-binding protein, partial [Chloroflexota bacterium]